jgi:hypothetical protein
MKKWLVCLAAAAIVTFLGSRAHAKPAAVYVSAQAGAQTRGDTGAQYGVEGGGHVFIFDGYVSYMALGENRSVSRGIVGLRGGLEVGFLRFVLRGGVGAIREVNGALTVPVGSAATLTRTGFVARGGGELDARLWHGLYLGVAIDGESFGFLKTNGFSFAAHGNNVLGVGKLTFEFGF